MLRRTAAVLAAGAVLFALSGCQLRLAVEVEVDRDGGGTLTVTLAADEALVQRAEEAGTDPLTDLAEAVAEIDGWRVSERDEEEGGRAVTVSARFADPDGLASLSAALVEALDAPEVTLLEPLAVEVGPEQVTLRGGAGLVPTEHVAELGLLPDDAVRLASEQDAVAYTIVAHMPGEVLSSTADAVDGRRAVWRIEPGESASLSAVAERPPDRLPAMLAGGLLGALVAAGAGWLLLRRLRRPSPPAQSDPRPPEGSPNPPSPA